MTANPFSKTYDTKEDLQLIAEAKNGSREALESLIKRHQDYIYNVAHKLVMNEEDAADITQEALIKIVINLAKFNHQSSFRTWAYRIVVNHFLNVKKKRTEKAVVSFENFGMNLDQTPDNELTPEEMVAQADDVKEARMGCMSAMLICLDRDQRILYVLGEIFQIDHNAGAEIFGISKENFRKRLSRARQDLHAFMDNKCGLINKDNPCRCHRKTKAFIKRGWVDPQHYNFAKDHLDSIHRHVVEKSPLVEEAVDKGYVGLYQEHPFQRQDYSERIRKTILQDPEIREIFELES